MKSLRKRIKTNQVIKLGQRGRPICPEFPELGIIGQKPKLVRAWDDVRQEPGWGLPIRW